MILLSMTHHCLVSKEGGPGFIDTAAGILLVQEAGGLVTDWWGRGAEHFERSGILIVANRSTHAYLLSHLQKTLPPS